MRTLLEQRKRLEREIIATKEMLAERASESVSDIKTIQLHKDTIERNMQLISMIDNHLRLDHRPMWRTKSAID